MLFAPKPTSFYRNKYFDSNFMHCWLFTVNKTKHNVCTQILHFVANCTLKIHDSFLYIIYLCNEHLCLCSLGGIQNCSINKYNYVTLLCYYTMFHDLHMPAEHKHPHVILLTLQDIRPVLECLKRQQYCTALHFKWVNCTVLTGCTALPLNTVGLYSIVLKHMKTVQHCF